MLSLHFILFIEHHIITQVIEAELGVCAICYIAVICGTLLIVAHTRKHYAYSLSEEAEHLAHFLRLELSEVIVDGNDMNALSVERICICSQAGNECFTFTCLHFGDTSLMQDDSAYYLDRERLFTQNSPCSLTADGKSIGQHIVKGAQSVRDLILHQLSLLS